MTHDVIIAGAGPAGCAAARLLRAWGHDVLLLHRPGSKPVNLAESLPPSAVTALHLAGVQDVASASAIATATGNVSWWGTGAPRIETYPEGRMGLHLHRSRFDELLRESTPFVEAAARSAELKCSLFHVTYGGETAIAPYVLDCSGRAGVIARQGLRLTNDGLRTIAASGVWRSKSEFPTDPRHTLVEAYRDGWAWAIPLSPSELYVGVLIDSGHTDRVSGQGVEPLYLGELAKTLAFHELLRDAQLSGTPSACDASVYTASRYAESGALLVGDAASFIDPISSFGIKKALTAAWLAAVAVHTALTDPGAAPLAFDYYETRQRQSDTDLLRNAAQYFRVIAQHQEHAFWRHRAAQPANDLYEPGQLMAELERLRALPSIRLRQNGLVMGKRASVVGNKITLSDAYTTCGLPHGLEYACGVDLMKLAALADRHEQVPALHEAYNLSQEPVDLPNFLGALCLLLVRKVLVYA